MVLYNINAVALLSGFGQSFSSSEINNDTYTLCKLRLQLIMESKEHKTTPAKAEFIEFSKAGLLATLNISDTSFF